jgi:hypothetical protein
MAGNGDGNGNGVATTTMNNNTMGTKSWWPSLSWVHVWLTASHVFFMPAAYVQWYKCTSGPLIDSDVLDSSSSASMASSSHRYENTIEFIKFVLIIGVMMASSLMHISETKHGLSPDRYGITSCGRCLTRYSTTFLRCDIIMASFTTLFYFIFGWFDHPFQWTIFVVLAIGGILMHTGEKTMDLVLYFRLHASWHACVSLALFLAVAYNN